MWSISEEQIALDATKYKTAYFALQNTLVENLIRRFPFRTL